MSEIIFREVRLGQSPDVDESLMTLIKNELRSTRSFSSFQRNIDYGSGNTHVLGGFIGRELACVNVFTRLKFIRGAALLVGYQSGFSSTSRHHRGKGLWSKLMGYSEEFLAARGASFVFGYPNPVSYPLFVTKLGYHSMNLHHLVLLPPPFRLLKWNRRMGVDANAGGYDHTLKPDLADNIAWKRRESGVDGVGVYEFRQSRAWGKIRCATRLGFKIRFLEIGGLDLSSRADLDGLLKVASAAARVRLLHISLNEENEYFTLFKAVRNKCSPVIVKPLDGFAIPDWRINFFGGMRDTF